MICRFPYNFQVAVVVREATLMEVEKISATLASLDHSGRNSG